MTIETRDFGAVEIDELEIIKFKAPVLGFEDEDEYVLLIDDELDGMFSFLQSVKTPEVCFILTDPAFIYKDYAPTISKQTKQELGAGADDALAFRVITIIPDDFTKATANLKSPVVICPATKKASQIVLDDDYPLRAPLCETEG